jgi:hypothetical protein
MDRRRNPPIICYPSAQLLLCMVKGGRRVSARSGVHNGLISGLIARGAMSVLSNQYQASFHDNGPDLIPGQVMWDL